MTLFRIVRKDLTNKILHGRDISNTRVSSTKRHVAGLPIILKGWNCGSPMAHPSKLKSHPPSKLSLSPELLSQNFTAREARVVISLPCPKTTTTTVVTNITRETHVEFRRFHVGTGSDSWASDTAVPLVSRHVMRLVELDPTLNFVFFPLRGKSNVTVVRPAIN